MNTKPNDQDFNCLAFKDRVQSEIYEETKDLSRPQLKKYLRRRVETGPFGEFWKGLYARGYRES